MSKLIPVEKIIRINVMENTIISLDLFAELVKNTQRCLENTISTQGEDAELIDYYQKQLNQCKKYYIKFKENEKKIN